jgi:putative transposase
VISEEKQLAIKVSLKATRDKRKHQRCRVFELKITGSKMSRNARNHFSRLFLEAKWFYNHVLGQKDVFNADTKVKTVMVKTGEVFEERSLVCLSSQMKQALAKRIQSSIKGLATKKKKGVKAGRLKFKRSFGAVPLKQHGITYSFTNSGHRLKFQKMKGSVRIRGYDQLPPGAELANAVLVKRASGYYLKVTVHVAKENTVPSPRSSSIGIDGGIKHQFAFSNGVLVDYRVPVSQCRSLRKKYRRFSRKKKGSRNRTKALAKLLKEFEHLSNSKRDITNKLCAFLNQEYRVISFQKENLSAWQRLYGKKMLDTSLGSFYTAVKERTDKPVEVERFFPSTQLCSAGGCDHRQKMERSERVYRCPVCGLVLDRDINAARNIEREGLRMIANDNDSIPANDSDDVHHLGTERAEITPVEITSSTLAQRMVAYFNTIPRVSARRVVETGSPLL